MALSNKISYRLNDSDQIIEDETFSTKDLVNGDTVNFTIETQKKPDPKFTLKVNKDWTKNVQKPEAVKIKLYSEKAGEKTLVEEFQLDGENNFEKEFTDLLISEDGDVLNYSIEEVGDKFKPSYSYVINDGESMEGSKLTGAELSNGDVVKFSILNDQDLPKETTTPEKPNKNDKPVR